MHEPDLESEEPAPRLVVDQLRAVGREPVELGADVVDGERQMVHPRASLGEELADGRLRAEGGEKLDASVADAERRGLDALVGHCLAMLELGAEQPPVRLHGLVQIVDGDSEMMDATCGHDHDASVGGMRQATLAVLALTVLVAAGCGGAKGNGEAAKPPGQILKDAREATRHATSVHVYGSGTADGQPLRLDLYLVAGRGGRGRVTANGLTFDLIRIGRTAYFRGGPDFWNRFGAGAAASLLEGRWLAAPADSGDFAAFRPLTDVSKLFDAVLSGHGSLARGATKRIGKQPAIGVVDRGENGGTLYVATTGKPYPLAVVSAQGRNGTIHFGSWDAEVALNAPPSPIDIAKLKALAKG